MNVSRSADSRVGRAGTTLLAWLSALVVIAHPDNESFGLGAVIDQLTVGSRSRAYPVLHPRRASPLNQTQADLHSTREAELGQAARVTLLDYPDGGLAGIPAPELAGHVGATAARVSASGVLVFDDTGVTGHLDHKAAMGAAVLAGRHLHATQISPAAVLWRRLQLLGECKHLR